MQIILKMSTCVAPPAPMNKKAGSLKALHRQDSETVTSAKQRPYLLGSVKMLRVRVRFSDK